MLSNTIQYNHHKNAARGALDWKISLYDLLKRLVSFKDKKTSA